MLSEWRDPFFFSGDTPMLSCCWCFTYFQKGLESPDSRPSVTKPWMYLAWAFWAPYQFVSSRSWDILIQKQAVCLWGQSCDGVGWYHIARLSHRLSPIQRRDQLPAASEQRHPGDIFQDSLGGRWYYDVSWSHIDFILVSRIFQDTRWSEYWSSVLGPCIGSWSVKYVYNWVGPCLVWDRDHCCCSPLMRGIPRDPNFV